MHHTSYRITRAICLLTSLIACAPKAVVLLPEPRPLGSGLPAYTASSGAPGTIQRPQPREKSSATLTREDALARALMYNPELAVSSWEAQSGAARADQARLYPNPELEVEVEEFGGSKEKENSGKSSDAYRRFEGAETTVKMNQLVELGGKRSKRTRVATLEHSVLGWDYEAKRLDVITAVTTSFMEALALQKRLLLTGDLVKISQDVFNTVSERVSAGKVAPIEETKAKIALSTVQIEQHRMKRELESARKKLAASWGSTNPDFVSVTGQLETISPPPSFEQLLSYLPQNPDIARWSAEVEQREAALEAARADRIPDLTLGAGVKYLNESDDETYLMALSLPLPLLNRNQGNIREASYSVSRTKEEAAAAEVKITTALHETYQNLSSAFDEVTTLRDTVLPGARDSFNAAQEGYVEGKFSYLMVLDAQRTLIETEQEYVNALIEYHTSKSLLERLVAQQL